MILEKPMKFIEIRYVLIFQCHDFWVVQLPRNSSTTLRQSRKMSFGPVPWQKWPNCIILELDGWNIIHMFHDESGWKIMKDHENMMKPTQTSSTMFDVFFSRSMPRIQPPKKKISAWNGARLCFLTFEVICFPAGKFGQKVVPTRKSYRDMLQLFNEFNQFM